MTDSPLAATLTMASSLNQFTVNVMYRLHRTGPGVMFIQRPTSNSEKSARPPRQPAACTCSEVSGAGLVDFRPATACCGYPRRFLRPHYSGCAGRQPSGCGLHEHDALRRTDRRIAEHHRHRQCLQRFDGARPGRSLFGPRRPQRDRRTCRTFFRASPPTFEHLRWWRAQGSGLHARPGAECRTRMPGKRQAGRPAIDSPCRRLCANRDRLTPNRSGRNGTWRTTTGWNP